MSTCRWCGLGGQHHDKNCFNKDEERYEQERRQAKKDRMARIKADKKSESKDSKES